MILVGNVFDFAKYSKIIANTFDLPSDIIYS